MKAYFCFYHFFILYLRIKNDKNSSKSSFPYLTFHTILTLSENYYQTILTYSELISNSIHTFTELLPNNSKHFFESLNGQLNRKKILKQKIPKQINFLIRRTKNLLNFHFPIIIFSQNIITLK